MGEAPGARSEVRTQSPSVYRLRDEIQGLSLAAAAHSVQPWAADQASYLIPAEAPAGSAHQVPHFPYPVNTVVLFMNSFDLRNQQLIV